MTYLRHIPSDIAAKVDEIMARNKLAFGGGFTMLGLTIEQLEERRRGIATRMEEHFARLDARAAAAGITDRHAKDSGFTMLASEQREYAKIVEDEADCLRLLGLAREREDRLANEATARQRLGLGNTNQDGRPTGRGYVGGADTVYGRANGESYFADLIRSATPGDPGQLPAMMRLQQHGEMIERAVDDLPAEFRATHERGAAGNMEKRVNPNRTDGQGGNFVPPLWIMDEYVELLRNGRTAADRCMVRPLPAGTDSINLPKVATGTATGVQTADAGAVTSQDLTDTSVNGPVRTIAGQQDISLQLFEQSPINFDEVVFADLIEDYNEKLTGQVLSGSGAAGQVTGILTIAGTNAVTYTDATPTLPEMLVPIGQGLSQVAKNGKRISDTILMHPSLWYWMTTQLDTANRPLVDLGNGQNSIAVYDENAVAGVAGSIGNTQVAVDLNTPTNLGAGTNETRIIEGRFKEVFLYEGALRTRALVEVLSGTLQVRLQVYNYVALIANRRPAALSVIAGTGLIPAAGF